MNDHSFGTTFGASTQGAINLVSGQTNGAVASARAPPLASWLMAKAASPSLATKTRPTTSAPPPAPRSRCRQEHRRPVEFRGRLLGLLRRRLQPVHHQLQRHDRMPAERSYWQPRNRCGEYPRQSAEVGLHPPPPAVSVLRQHRQPKPYPSRLDAGIGTAADTGATTANHQYDILTSTQHSPLATLPAVSFLKAPGYQDGHAGYSDPLDEQTFVVNDDQAIENSSYLVQHRHHHRLR